MSFEALQERLAALQETTTQLKELIDRLANLKFSPGSVPLAADDDDNVGAELSAEISQILKEEEEDLEVLQEEITDLRSGRPGSEAEHIKARLKDGAARLEDELRSSRVAFRKAQLAAKRNLAQAQRQERALLLASYVTPLTRSGATSPELDGGNTSGSGSAQQQQQPQQPPSTGYVPPHKRRHRKQQDGNDTDGRDGAVVSAASDVTAALRRTHDLMAGELARSDFARQTLAESSAALAQLGESYGSLDTLLAGSRDLLGALLRSQKSDTWYLETALYLLVGTLGWLVFRRWLYGPLWWLVWLPLRTVLGLGFRAGKGAVGIARGPEAARMEVVGGGVDGGREGTRVVGMADGSVPTAKVGSEAHRGSAERSGDPDSMVDKVGRIVDGNQAEEDQPRNPKKRMWEGDRDMAQEAQRARDEL